MKRLATILILLALLTVPTLAQTPVPSAVSTPGTIPSDEPAPATPPAQAEGTPEAPVATDTVPVSVVVDLLERQPELLADMTKIATDQIGYAYERSIVLGIVFTVAGAVVVLGGGFWLYRSTPTERRPAIARQIGGAVSVGLGRLDELDVIPGTDIDNLLLRAGKDALDKRIAAIDAVVEAKVQSLYEAEKERKRANEAAQQANRVLNGEPQNVTPMPPMGPAN